MKRVNYESVSVRRSATAAAVVLLSVLTAGLAASQTLPQPPPRPAPKAIPPKATCQGICGQLMKLLQAKMPEAALEKTVRDQPSPLNLTADELIALKKAGATDGLITLMVTHPGTSGAAPAGVAQPSVAASVVPAQASPSPAAPASIAIPASLPACSSSDQGERKLVVAIEDFDYSTVRTSVQAIFGTEQDIGAGIRALLTKRLGEQGKVTLVERKKIDNVIKEQDFAASSRVRKGTGSRIGRITGAQAILAGDIVAFGRDDRKIKAGGLGGAWGAGIGAIGGAFSKDKAVVVINYRLIDAETSEIMDNGEARGESLRKSKALGPCWRQPEASVVVSST